MLMGNVTLQEKFLDDDDSPKTPFGQKPIEVDGE